MIITDIFAYNLYIAYEIFNDNNILNYSVGSPAVDYAVWGNNYNYNFNLFVEMYFH